MADYRIVASDLDGTLLNTSGRVSEENLQAIAEMKTRGVYFVPCTGRTLNEMDPLIRDNPNVRYIIHSDGAVVYDKLLDERISLCMPREDANKLLDILGHYDTFLAVRYDKNVYMDADMQTDAVYDAFRIDSYSREEVMPWSTKKSNFEAFCRSMKEIEMVGVFFLSEKDRQSCVRELTEAGIFGFIEWDGLIYCEIFSKTAGKGNALLALADRIGCQREQTVGVGDSTNDLTLIRSAGLGLAMSNACAPLKNAADEIICNNDEHAIKYILEHYL